MSMFTPLEQMALAKITGEAVELRATIEQQLSRATVVSRENIGSGFFAKLEVERDAKSLDAKIAPLGRNVWIGIEGLAYGLGMILHFKNGRASLLEGYAVGPEDTSGIDFAHTRFAMRGEPGPMPTKVC